MLIDFTQEELKCIASSISHRINRMNQKLRWERRRLEDIDSGKCPDYYGGGCKFLIQRYIELKETAIPILQTLYEKINSMIEQDSK